MNMTKCYLIMDEYTALISTTLADFFREQRQPYSCRVVKYDDYAEITVKCPNRYARDVENLLQWFV